MAEEYLEDYISFIKESERLKTVLRTAWLSDGSRESTAVHSWRLALLVGILLDEFPEVDGKKALMLALIHDLGEIYDGVVSAALRPDAGEKYRKEKKAVDRLAEILGGEAGEKLRELWKEYEDGKTAEARLVKALDKAETIIQHNQGKNPPDFDYQFNLEYGRPYFQREYFRGGPSGDDGGEKNLISESGLDLLARLRREIDEDTAGKIGEQGENLTPSSAISSRS